MRTNIEFVVDCAPPITPGGGLGCVLDVAHHLAGHARAVGTKVSGPHLLMPRWDICVTFGKTEFWLLLEQRDGKYRLMIDSVWDWRSVFGIEHHPEYRKFVGEILDWLKADSRFVQIQCDFESALQ